MKKEYGLAPVAEVRQPPNLNTRNVGIGSLFNGMLRPIIPYAIRGAVWYQGEANARSAFGYREELPLLINDWRKHWQMKEMPFYYCQLPQYRAKEDNPGLKSEWAELREAQLMTLSVPGAGMAVLTDTGESEDIHPLAKDVAGERLARNALANVYGQSIPYSGPIYNSMQVEGNKIRLNFRCIEGGLVAKELPAEYDVNRTRGETAPLVRNSPDSELEGFAICGADQQWVWADAKIDPSTSSGKAGETVLVWSDKVASPVAVRYAWADNPSCNLYNKAGLPASPFRTDDFPISTQGK
jgi:sialate O-acetylesterase